MEELWTSNTMSFSQSLLISLMGLAVVLIALTVLAIMITLFSKIFENLNKNKEKQVVSNADKKEGLAEEEIGAIIISAVCEDLRVEPDCIRITSIREI